MTTKTLFAYGTTTSVQLVAHWCNGCNIPYGLPNGFIEDRRRDGKSWTCPNGCVRLFQQTEDQLRAEKAEAELRAARELAARESSRRRLAESQRAAARGQVTRIRNRVGNGICPCCQRTFKDLGQHMAGEHPDFRVEEDEPNPTLEVTDLSPNQRAALAHVGAEVDRGGEGVLDVFLHRSTVGALVRRGVVEHRDGGLVVPTLTGLRLIAEVGITR
jgi:hypothetical protein